VFRLRAVNEVIEESIRYLRHHPSVKRVSLIHALNKISGETVYSAVMLPPFPKSTMDGYAVKSSNCSSASPSSPVILKIKKESILAGEKGNTLGENEAIRIETGGFLPEGADAVIPVEDTEQRGNLLYVYKSIGKYENVSLPGEELDINDIIIRKGDILRPWHLAALEAIGREEVGILDIKACVFCTGSEFKEKFKPFTRKLVKGWLLEKGFTEVSVKVLPDDVDIISKNLGKAVMEYDVIIVCGGTAKGEKDYTIKAIQKLNPSYLLHGVRIRPGRTMCFSVVNDRPVVAISGLPVAAFSSLELVVKPILERWLKIRFLEYPKIRAKLVRRVTSKMGFKSFIRLRVYERKGQIYAEPLVAGGSGSIRSLVLGNAFLIVEEDLEGFDEGEEVEVELYAPVYKENL